MTEHTTEATMPCGCQITREATIGEVQGITFCPVHGAAPALVEALKALTEETELRVKPPIPYLTALVLEKALAAIKAATEEEK